MKRYLALLLLALPFCLLAQNKVTITGKVTAAEDNETLIGVTVKEKAPKTEPQQTLMVNTLWMSVKIA